MKFFFQVLGFCFVLSGLLLPLGAGYLFYSRGAQLKAYFKYREEFATLPPKLQEQQKANLAAMVAGRGVARKYEKKLKQLQFISEIKGRPSHQKSGEE